MKILIIRHGDPDYEHDTLTDKGWREARLLAGWAAKADITKAYVSPLGRARDTMRTAMEGLDVPIEECEWLREFSPQICRPDVADRRKIAWDWLPDDWAREPVFYDRDKWASHPIMAEAGVKEEYDWVIRNFDSLLARHGYVYDDHRYRAERANRDTLAFFCHFGLECVLLSRLLDAPPMVLWHHLCAAPTSVTTLVSEERRRGIAIFRMTGFGDVPHLYANGEPPSFHARFCETYDSADERHD